MAQEIYQQPKKTKKRRGRPPKRRTNGANGANGSSLNYVVGGRKNPTLIRVLPQPVEGGTVLEGVRSKVFLDRYSLKDEEGKALEKHPEQMWRRVARAIAQVEKPEDRKIWEERFYRAMEGFKFVPGGRILSGAGTGFAVTYYNCYVLPSPADSRDGILDNLKEMIEVMARGGGAGINLSSLRPRGARVKKVNGFSSGPMNWAELHSIATREIVQQGGTRRGALMLMLWDWHPDVEEFITTKEDLSRIQGANLSVCVSDAFMKAVKADGDWDLVFPALDDPEYDEKWDGDVHAWAAFGKKVKVYKTVKARYLWDLICKAAWKSAEPGLHFMERTNKWSNNWYFNKLICTNPCVTGDTRVATEKGWIPAKDLRPGTRILTPKGLKPIKKVYNNGPQRIFKVRFSDGGVLKATADHKLRVVENKKFDWREVRYLKKGDKIVVLDKGAFGQKAKLPQEAIDYAKTHSIKVPEIYDRNLGFMMGVTIGDGYFGQIGQRYGYRMKIALARREKEWEKALVHKFTEFGVTPSVSTTEYQAVYPDGTTATHGATMLNLYKFANVLGLSGLETRSGDEKRIPPKLLNLGEQFQAGLLDGLFSTDGSVNLKTHDPALRLTSSSRKLLGQVRLILLNFGIHAKVYKTKRRHTEYNGRDITGTGFKYELLVMNEGIEQFYRKIGLTHPEKTKRLEQAAQYYFMGKTGLVRVLDVVDTGREEAVYDVLEPETLTWITNGYLSLDCGEEPLPAYGVCNLASLNLSNFVTEEGDMDYRSLAEHAKVAVRFQDNVIDGDIYVLPGIVETQLNGERRIGLGTMGLGDALIKMKVRYGAEDSLPVIEKIYRTIRDAAYEASSDIAREKGAFPKFDAKKYLQGQFIKGLSKNIRAKVRKHGVRNSVLLMQAPTGSTSLLSGATSGIEPVYEFSFIRRDRLGEHKIYHSLYDAWRKENPGRERPGYFVSANDLTPEDHVRVQAAVQKYVDASISKTVNAPKTHTVEDVKRLYTLAYDLGLKGITYMRDESRPGVLSRDDKKGEHPLADVMPKAPQGEPQEAKQELGVGSRGMLSPRPEKAIGATYRIVTPSGSAFITINEDERGEPLEVFINIGRAGSDITALAEALGRTISSAFRLRGDLAPQQRAIEIVGQLSGIGGRRSVGFGPNKVRSLPDAVAMALGKHFNFKVNGNGSHNMQAGAVMAAHNPDPTPAPAALENSLVDDPLVENSNPAPSADICPECGSVALVHEEGCAKCYACGHAEC